MSNIDLHQISGEGDRTSFFKLFSENDFRVVIPMIQREYAQGRDTAKEVRTDFLKALYDYLNEGTPERDLDFIYGNIKGKDFIPLDGQQRLTTLFLLHWYLSRITEDTSLRERFDSALLDKERRHSRFTYETRSSSKEFCDALMLNEIDFINLLPASEVMPTGKKSIQKTIQDKNWFHLSWKKDPTIRAMLTMLDAIHEQFNGCQEFLAKLLDTNRPVVTFLFMHLDRYNLSDELYIKMNSRGKPLTDFENFKARYSEHIKMLLGKSEVKVARERLLLDGTRMKMPLDLYFAERIDNAWTNLMWAYRNDGDSDDYSDYGLMCDRRMTNLISALLALKYIELHPTTKGENDPIFSILANQTGREKLPFTTLYEGDALSLESTVFLIDTMDLLAASEGKPQLRLSKKFEHYLPLSRILDKILFSHRDLNYNDRAMLYAYLNYLLRYGNHPGIDHWMRVIHNLANAENNRIDSASELSNTIKNIRLLLDYAPNILRYLADGRPVDGFPSWLIEEERMKASLILRDNSKRWFDKILETERHGYFTGQIGFILEFAGIWERYQKENATDWSDAEDDELLAAFDKYSKAAQAVFAESYENRINDFNFRFERAVLFKGDYLPSNNLHYNLLSADTTRNNVKRDFSWKRHLRLDKDKDATERRYFVKAVFDDPAFDSDNPNESLKSVFEGKSTGDQWRDSLIKHPSAIQYCEQGFISFTRDVEGCEGILPMKSSRLSGYHKELYSWELYCDLKEIPSSPFNKGIGYEEQKVNDALPFLFFDGFCIDSCNHWISITSETNPEDWSLSGYRIEFIRDVNQNESMSWSRLKELLQSEGFQLTNDPNRLLIHVDDRRKVKIFLTGLFFLLSEFNPK